MAGNSYEKEQEKLQCLMNEALDMSDEDIPDPFEGDSGEDYIPSDLSSSDSECVNYKQLPKRRNLKNQTVSKYWIFIFEPFHLINIMCFY